MRLCDQHAGIVQQAEGGQGTPSELLSDGSERFTGPSGTGLFCIPTQTCSRLEAQQSRCTAETGPATSYD